MGSACGADEKTAHVNYKSGRSQSLLCRELLKSLEHQKTYLSDVLDRISEGMGSNSVRNIYQELGGGELLANPEMLVNRTIHSGLTLKDLLSPYQERQQFSAKPK